MGRPKRSSQNGADQKLSARHAFKPSGEGRAAARHGRASADERGVATHGPRMIPTRVVKAFAGVLLLPLCWLASKTFFDVFKGAAVDRILWLSDDFYYFACGAVYWIVAVFSFPTPLVIYVFGHELTHALWVWMQGGRVSGFKVGREGGYIIADRRDFLVSLAPYFFPLYSIMVIGVYAGISWHYPEAWHYRRWLFAAIGFTWAFHLSFTCWMIPKRQTDLLLHGTFFSLVIIYLANLAVLTVLLVVACPQVSWPEFGHRFRENAADLAQWVSARTGWRPPEIW